MASDRGLGLLSPLLLCLGLAAGCGSGEVRVCQDEQESMLADGTIRKERYRTVRDPTAGGVLSGAAPEGGDRPTKMVLLLDYSGSMFGGYGRARVEGCSRCTAGLKPDGSATRNGQPFYYEVAEFGGLLARWLDAATPPGTRRDLEVLLFNERLWRLGEDGVEPYAGPEQLTFSRPVSTASSGQIASWLRRIPDSPWDVDREAPNRTESRQALLAVLDAIQDEAIVWLLTDNIVDQGGGVVSADDARRNLEFYNTLRDDPRVQMISAYPLLEAEACSWMCGTSLLAYGMYVSRFERPAVDEFHRLGGTVAGGGGPTEDGLLWNRELGALAAEYSGRSAAIKEIDIAGVPLRLKPVDTEVLSFDFSLHQGQALSCSRQAEYGDTLRCMVRATVKNTLRHQTVDSASLIFANENLLPRKTGERRRLAWASAVCSGQMRPIAWRVAGGESRPVEGPIALGPLAPLETTVIDVAFDLPAVTVNTRLEKHLLDVAFTDRILLDGRIVAGLEDIQTSLFIDTEGMEGVYGAAQLPAIFRGHEQARIEAVYPAAAVVSNDGQLLGLLAVAGLGGIALLVALVVMRFQRLHLTVLVDGVELRKFGMPRLSVRALEIAGARRAVLVRRWGSTYKLRPRRGHKLKKDGTTWLLVTPGESEEYRVEVRRGWGRASRRRSGAESDDGW